MTSGSNLRSCIRTCAIGILSYVMDISTSLVEVLKDTLQVCTHLQVCDVDTFSSSSNYRQVIK